MSGERTTKARGDVRGTGRNLKKSELPSKLCAVCARPFTWRKKWARDWESVKYCSRRCAASRGAG